MIVSLNEKDHIYMVDGEIADISITELLTKHGLAPSYDGAFKADLAKYAEYGKAIHKDLERVVNVKDHNPTTEQGQWLLQWVQENLDCGVGEQMLAWKQDGWSCAGTADLFAYKKDGYRIMVEYKTTSVVYKEAVSWQLSIADYMARKLNEPINGVNFAWKGAKEFYCIHCPKGKTPVVVEITPVSDAEIEKLFWCEMHGEQYQRPLLVVDSELVQQVERAEQALAEIETTYKEAERNAKELRQKLVALFEKQNIKSWESPNGICKVTYVAPQDRLSVDSTKLKREYPQVWQHCQKLTKVKASVRVTIKGESENDDF